MTSVYHPSSVRNAGSSLSSSNKSASPSIARTSSGATSGPPTSVPQRAHVEASGYLLKQGSSSYSTFRKRWFELSDGKLLYFETRLATFELGLIDLVNVTLIDAGAVAEPATAVPAPTFGSFSGSGSKDAIPNLATASYPNNHSGSSSLSNNNNNNSHHHHHYYGRDDDERGPATSNVSDSFRFRIETPKRVYQLVAASEAEMWHWIASLRLARLVVHERELARDALRRQIDVGRRARDQVAAAAAMLEVEHAGHSEARRRLGELAERNEQLREWNERIATQLEATELEHARTREKLDAALHFVAAFEQAKLAGAELVRRLDHKEQQLQALRAQLLAITGAAADTASTSSDARDAAAAAEQEPEPDLSVSNEALLWSLSCVDVGERSIADLRSELRRRSELEASAPSPLSDAGAAAGDGASANASAAAVPAEQVVASARPAVPLEAVENCGACKARFTLLRWKKRCHGCNGVFCGDCVPHTVTIRMGGEYKSTRVCEACFERALAQKLKPRVKSQV